MIPNWFVVVMGLGTVFVGLICIIIILKIMGAIIGKVTQKKPAEAVAAPAAEPVKMAEPDKGALMAAVSAAIAETMGKDVSGIRIHSFKKIG